MTSLTLIKKHIVANDGTLPCERVVGVQEPNASAVFEYGFSSAEFKDTVEQDIEMGSFSAEALAEFYRRVYHQSPEERPYHNCHLFAWYLAGAVDTLQRYDSYDAEFEDLYTDWFAPGCTYVIKDSTGKLAHSLVGTGQIGETLSVTGDYNPMIIMSTRALMNLYDGVRIRRTIPLRATVIDDKPAQ